MKRKSLYLSLMVLVGIIGWIVWAENNPEAEKDLRHQFCDEVAALFPEGMEVERGEFGLFHRVKVAEPDVVVVLVHGLDEPGDIWDDLRAHWSGRAVDIWEFCYPNDQSVRDSVELLKREWGKLSGHSDCTLIGHSMGGLVARAFLGSEEAVGVSTLIMLGTPNQGSEWARFRVWLELRDHFPDGELKKRSLLSGLRDGCGEAKIDLRPGSDFLRQLNARRLNPSLEVMTVAGLIGSDWIDAQMGETRTGREAPLIRVVLDQLRMSTEGLGDGVVPYESTQVEGLPVPLIVDASHRGMIRNLVNSARTPPAIPLIDDFLGL